MFEKHPVELEREREEKREEQEALARRIAEGQKAIDKRIEEMRIQRLLYRIPLTDMAIASRIPRWRVQQIFARTFTPAKLGEVDALEEALTKLGTIARARLTALDEVRREAETR
jgi:hypothetical protein